MQKKFFAHFLKGEDAWGSEPKVRLQIRYPGEGFVERHEEEWPLARTQWTKFYLDAAGYLLGPQPPAGDSETSYKGFSEGVTFLTPPLERDMEITGPVAARLWVSSATEDTDRFLVLRPSAPISRRSCSRARTIRTRRSASAGCACRTASSMPPEASPTMLIMPTIRSSR
jgi:predicted acyl esterase